MDIEYSVIIRTTGNAGIKYRKLLTSIQNLIPAPKEVIVVLPDGYSLPQDRIGVERFVFCEKGMVIQRLTGIQACNTRYALISDDDISFEKNFVMKLYEGMQNGNYGLAAGPLVEFFPEKGLPTIMSAIMGAAVYGERRLYNRILRTAGYRYNRNIREDCNYESQSAPWTCFFADIKKLNEIDFEAERYWLDKNGYSAHDDTTMFYKAWLRGIKTVIVGSAKYQHLDAGTSRKNSWNFYYSEAFNTYIFWHRFIYSLEVNKFGKLKAKIAIKYRMFAELTYLRLNLIRHRIKKTDMQAFKSGLEDAKTWVQSTEYLSLPVVR